MSSASGKRPPMYRVRSSRIHGRGVFATRRIRKGTRIIEYVGDRVSHAEADRRYEDRPADDNHTFRLQEDAPPCHECGAIMVRGGACYKCLNCGATSGCS